MAGLLGSAYIDNWGFTGVGVGLDQEKGLKLVSVEDSRETIGEGVEVKGI